jgi:hypothetical protein
VARSYIQIGGQVSDSGLKTGDAGSQDGDEAR